MGGVLSTLFSTLSATAMAAFTSWVGEERRLAVPPPPAGQGQTGGPSMAAPGAAMGGVLSSLFSTLRDTAMARFTSRVGQERRLAVPPPPAGQGQTAPGAATGGVLALLGFLRDTAMAIWGGQERRRAVPPPPAGQDQTGGPSTAAPGAGPQVSITNESGKVQAPVFSNATFTDNSNMTFN
ncbi:hypothetical protein SKAU_G00295320 [Synaphobranchus kaupii]|uniref:Uncharacterized protein n=1 Tax=Synaphobranchus kaupii TaxID=118154 RepID=A0A9Q1EUK4_SYNKA|nr:hypothetical protein SKAU_G00295320 [Synaphobranchus kaupii]